MTVLYKLAREQLSKASHYDFGLRALKAVLVMAGALKRASPHMPEALVLMRALRDMNLPKFVYDDVPLFLGLIRDLFPGERLPTLTHGCCDHCTYWSTTDQGPLANLRFSGLKISLTTSLSCP